MASVKINNNYDNIEEKAKSKYRANILHQITLLVFSPKPVIAQSYNLTGPHGSICAVTVLCFSSIGSGLHRDRRCIS